MSVNIQTLQTQLAAADKNFISFGQTDGPVETTTSTWFGRWRASRPNAEQRAQNQATIDNFVNRLRNVSGYGNALADAVRERLGTLYQAGKPLSGRAAAAVLAETLPAAQDAYRHRRNVELNVADMAAKTTAGEGGLIKTMGGDLAKGLGVSEEELADWQAGIQTSVRFAMQARANETGKTPSTEELRQAVREAVIAAFAADRGPALMGDLEEGEIVDPETFPMLQLESLAMAQELRDRAGSLFFVFGNVVDSPESAQENLRIFGRMVDEAMAQLPQDTSSEERSLALHLALQAALAHPEAPALLGKLASPGSHFLQAMRQMDGEGAPPWVKTLCQALGAKLDVLTSPDNAMRPNFNLPISPSLLPLRQRPDLRREGAQDMTSGFDMPMMRPHWRENALTSVTNMAKWENEGLRDPSQKKLYPSGFSDVNDMRWTVSAQFTKDVSRSPVSVNGQRVETTEAYLAMMPDRRAAAQVSRALHQGLGAIIPESAPADLKNVLYGYVQPHMVSPQTSVSPQSSSVMSLGNGAFRVTYEFGKHMTLDRPSEAHQKFNFPELPSDQLAPTDLRGSISFTVQTGSQMAIRDLEVDAVLLGMLP